MDTLLIQGNYVRKAILFWTRKPKIDHRIWITIVKDERPYYPLEEEEARNLLFDFQKNIEIESSKLEQAKIRSLLQLTCHGENMNI